MTTYSPIVYSKKSAVSSIDITEVFSTLSNPTRLRIMEELERQGLIPFSRFKELLDIDNESTLNSHLDKLARAMLIQKSPHMNGWELTENGSKMLNLIDSLEGEVKYSVGPMISIILTGSIPITSFDEVENSLKARRTLEIVTRTQEYVTFRLAEPGIDVSLEVWKNGQFNAAARIPLTHVLSVTGTSALKRVEEEFVHFFNLIPEEANEQIKTEERSLSKVPSWILMANGLLWSVVYFLFSSAINVNPEATLTSIRYLAAME